MKIQFKLVFLIKRVFISLNFNSMCYIYLFGNYNETQIKFRYYTQIILCKRNIENNRLRESSEILASCGLKTLINKYLHLKLYLSVCSLV